MADITLDVTGPPPAAPIRPAGGSEWREEEVEVVTVWMSGVTLLWRNIIFPDKHCSRLM